MSSDVTRTWAGSPSRIATREGPWDSPAVSQRSMGAVFHGRYVGPPPSCSDEMAPGGRAEDRSQKDPGQQERAERQRGAQRRPVATGAGSDDAQDGEDREGRVEPDHQLDPAEVA